jgi:hypothetical protein
VNAASFLCEADQLIVAPITSMVPAYVMARLLVDASPTGTVGKPLSSRQERGSPMRTLHWHAATLPPFGHLVPM